MKKLTQLIYRIDSAFGIAKMFDFHFSRNDQYVLHNKYGIWLIHVSQTLAAFLVVLFVLEKKEKNHDAALLNQFENKEKFILIIPNTYF